MRILQHIWDGFWQGIGVEASFFILWLGWRAVHSRFAHKFDPEHFFHEVHDYFTQ